MNMCAHVYMNVHMYCMKELACINLLSVTLKLINL